MNFCKNVLGVTLMVTTHSKNHSMKLSAGGYFGLFLGSFWCMFLYFLRTVWYFLIKFCIDVCSTTLTVTTLKTFIHIIYFSWGSFWGIFGPIVLVHVCSSISWELFNIFSWVFFTDIFHEFFFIDVFSITLTVATLKNEFSHWFSFSARGHFVVFWKLTHEILYRYSWVILLQMVQNC